MSEFNKGEVWRSPSGLRYVVEKVEKDSVYFTRQLGVTRGFELIHVLIEDTLEWRKIQ